MNISLKPSLILFLIFNCLRCSPTNKDNLISWSSSSKGSPSKLKARESSVLRSKPMESARTLLTISKARDPWLETTDTTTSSMVRPNRIILNTSAKRNTSASMDHNVVPSNKPTTREEAIIQWGSVWRKDVSVSIGKRTDGRMKSCLWWGLRGDPRAEIYQIGITEQKSTLSSQDKPMKTNWWNRRLNEFISRDDRNWWEKRWQSERNVTSSQKSWNNTNKSTKNQQTHHKLRKGSCSE